MLSTEILLEFNFEYLIMFHRQLGIHFRYISNYVTYFIFVDFAIEGT